MMEKQKSNKPLTRFPEFKDAWEHKRLNELLSEAKKRNEDLKYGKDEVLSVSRELGIINQIEHLGRSYAGVSVHQYHVVEIGDIVYTKSPLKNNPYGIIKVNQSKPGIVSTLYAVYKVKNSIADGLYLDYYFSLESHTNNYLRPLVRKGAKNDMKVNNAYVLHDKIFIPSYPEQIKIASFFKLLDKKVNELKSKLALLEKYKTGIMQQLFSQKIRFKNQDGKEFPNWKFLKIGQLFTERSEKGYSNLELLSVSMNTGVQKKSDTAKTDNSSSDKSNYKKVDLNDIVYNSMRMWQGASGVSKYYGIVSPAYTVITPKPSVDSAYFGFLFKTKKMINIFERNSQGLTSDTWNLKFPQLSKIELYVPDIKEQKKIASFLNSIEEKINNTENELYQTLQYKKSLLQNMFI
jgi:type I restriction enzyme S subunit